MSYVFLSHSHQDKPFARRLAAELRHHGHIVWIDEAEILVGDSLVRKIEEGLDKVDYVVAVLSKASIASEWVRKELEAAMNREIGAKQVVVLPVLLEDADLPPFLRGKRYADFRREDLFDSGVQDLLARLGKGSEPPQASPAEIELLRQQLAAVQDIARRYAKDLERQRATIVSHQSPALRGAIEKANKGFPHHRAINEAYAFEVGGMPVTLDYLLWAIAKERRKGSHPLAAFLYIEGKWDQAGRMLEAYSDYLGGPRGEGGKSKSGRKK